VRVHTGSCNGEWPGLPGPSTPPALVSYVFVFVSYTDDAKNGI